MRQLSRLCYKGEIKIGRELEIVLYYSNDIGAFRLGKQDACGFPLAR